MECTPWDIIGVESRLAFRRESGPKEEPEWSFSETFTWSQEFSSKLKLLIDHEAWDGDGV